MNNKKYGLNIDDNYVELFQKFLGYGDPLNSKIWFIGNEEKLIEKDKNDDNDFHEIPLERIINNKLNCSEGNKFNKDGFFTKKFSEINGDGSGWIGYKMMNKKASNLDDLFISEIFFLPSMDGNDLGFRYGTKENNRKKFYNYNNNLEILLEQRVKELIDILNNKKCKCKTIYFYGNNEYKKELLRTFLSFDTIGYLETEKRTKNKKGIFERKIEKEEILFGNYRKTKVFIIPFITLNFKEYNIFSEIDKIYNNHINKNLNKHLNDPLNNWVYNNDELCDDCKKGRLVSQYDINDNIMYKCVECGHFY